MCQPLDTGRRSTHVSTHGHGQEEVPEVSKLLRSDDVDDIGRDRSERSERSLMW